MSIKRRMIQGSNANARRRSNASGRRVSKAPDTPVDCIEIDLLDGISAGDVADALDGVWGIAAPSWPESSAWPSLFSPAARLHSATVVRAFSLTHEGAEWKKANGHSAYSLTFIDALPFEAGAARVAVANCMRTDPARLAGIDLAGLRASLAALIAMEKYAHQLQLSDPSWREAFALCRARTRHG